MAPVTEFAVKEKYTYLNGFGSYHESEAIPGACPQVNNHPQKPPHGLRTERLSNTSFTAPRDETLHTWMYRVHTSLNHTPFRILERAARAPDKLSPNAYAWPTFPAWESKATDWTKQHLLAGNGDPISKSGFAIWLFNITKDMPLQTAYSSLDGDVLIIPQSGTLDIQTELGKLIVRQNEIAVIPRGLRYRVTVPDGPCRGYVCELYRGHFRLPTLGVIGSTGLANIRDFQVPVAHFDGSLVDGVARPTQSGGSDWTIISRQSRALWVCEQGHTPFDVAAWHGTCYPFKYDLAKFCILGNALFDEHDPSLYTVLQVPSHQEPGQSVLEFAIIPPRWQVSEDSLWMPYCHRNTSAEFTAPIVTVQHKDHALNQHSDGSEFKPFGAVLHNCMTVHGLLDETIDKVSGQSTAPAKLQDNGMTIFLIESGLPLLLSDWAEQSAVQNIKEGFRGFEG